MSACRAKHSLTRSASACSAQCTADRYTRPLGVRSEPAVGHTIRARATKCRAARFELSARCGCRGRLNTLPAREMYAQHEPTTTFPSLVVRSEPAAKHARAHSTVHVAHDEHTHEPSDAMRDCTCAPRSVNTCRCLRREKPAQKRRGSTAGSIPNAEALALQHSMQQSRRRHVGVQAQGDDETTAPEPPCHAIKARIDAGVSRPHVRRTTSSVRTRDEAHHTARKSQAKQLTV